MIKAVLFDLGGTMHTATSPEGRDVWFADRLLRRLADYGVHPEVSPDALALMLHINGEEYKHHSEQTLRELPAAEIWSQYYLRGLSISREVLEPFAEELSFLYDYERVRVMRRPHLKQTVEKLRSMGIRMGVISNIISSSVVPHFLAEYGIEKDMECQVLSCVTGIRKPDPEIFRIAERAMGLAPEEMAYVGDTVSRDVRGTRNAGWRCMIQICSPATAKRDQGLENSGFKPDYLIEDLAEIPEIIEKENKK